MNQMQGWWQSREEKRPFENRFYRAGHQPCTIHSPVVAARRIDPGQARVSWTRPLVATLLGMTLALSAQAADDFVIKVDNDAHVPQPELDSILKDFRVWAVRVYAYNHVAHPAPVTLKLTRKVPFGFYEGE